MRRANEISPAAGREWGDNDANRSVRSALNKDLEALSKVYAERGRRIAEQTEVNHELSFVLTCLGGVALLLVVIGVVIIARSIARPLSVITATIKQVAEGAENVEVPHTARGDEIGALARAIKIFQEAMERNRNLNSQVSRELRGARRSAAGTSRPRSRSSGRRSARCCMRCQTNASAMRNTAQTITRVTSDASERAVAATGATSAGLRQRLGGRGRGRRAVGLGAGDRPPGPPFRRGGRADRPAHREVDHRDREPCRGDPAHRRRAAR